MITVSIQPIIEYCNVSESSEPYYISYSIPQLVALGKSSKVAKTKMRSYIDRIKRIASYLVDILNVLSMLSQEYHHPGEKCYLGEIKLFSDVFNFIIEKWGEGKNDLFPFALIQKSVGFKQDYDEKRRCYNGIKRKSEPKKDNNKMGYDEGMSYYNEMIDVCMNAINEWVAYLYNEFKKYCMIDNNQEYLFVFGHEEYTKIFKATISDAGDNYQKNKIDECISAFKELISEIDEVVIDTKHQIRPSKNEQGNVNNEDIDYRNELFIKYDTLKKVFDALKNIENENDEYYIEDNEERKIFKWNETKVLFTVLIMTYLENQTDATNFWRPFENAFDAKFRDSAKQYLDKSDSENNDKLNKARELIKKIEAYNKKSNNARKPV